jgi:hypothetical protein
MSFGMHTEMGRVALIEPHDGEIESITIALDGKARIQFSKLAVYHEQAAEEFAIWLYRANLQLTGVHHFVLHGSSSDFDDYVDDAVVSTGGIDIINWNNLIEMCAADRLHVTLGSGAVFTMGCSEVRLALETVVKRAGEWIGPLLASPPS